MTLWVAPGSFLENVLRPDIPYLEQIGLIAKKTLEGLSGLIELGKMSEKPQMSGVKSVIHSSICSSIHPPIHPVQWVSSLYHALKVKVQSVSHSVVSDSLPPHGLSPTRLLCPWDSPGKNAGVEKKKKNTGVSSHSLPQGIFLTQESNPGFLHCRQFLYHLSFQGSLVSCMGC